MKKGIVVAVFLTTFGVQCDVVWEAAEARAKAGCEGAGQRYAFRGMSLLAAKVC
jgi:hypothetical protein